MKLESTTRLELVVLLSSVDYLLVSITRKQPLRLCSAKQIELLLFLVGVTLYAPLMRIKLQLPVITSKRKRSFKRFNFFARHRTKQIPLYHRDICFILHVGAGFDDKPPTVDTVVVFLVALLIPPNGIVSIRKITKLWERAFNLSAIVWHVDSR